MARNEIPVISECRVEYRAIFRKAHAIPLWALNSVKTGWNMNIAGSIKAIRFAIDFVPSRYFLWRQRRFFLRNWVKYNITPIDGITVVGNLTAKGSIYKTLRDFVFSLKDAGIPCQTYDTCRKPCIPREDVAAILTPVADFQLRKYKKIIVMFDNPLPNGLGLDVSVIYFWEYTSAFLSAHPECLSCTSVIGMSDFNVDYFRSVLPDSIRVSKILYPFRFVSPRSSIVSFVRERYGISNDEFNVFFNFALSSSCGRKNPEGAIMAFAEAFRSNSNAKLIFKIFGSEDYSKELSKLKDMAERLGIRDRFLVIKDYLSQEEIYALTSICDVYLSLHRGEGLGLGIVEAMSLGKAVVVTGWSANTEFCNERNSMLIQYSILPVSRDKIDHIYMEKVETWAEPDVHEAAFALKRLYESPTLRKEIGVRAKTFIKNHFSIDNFRQSVVCFIGGQ